MATPMAGKYSLFSGRIKSDSSIPSISAKACLNAGMKVNGPPMQIVVESISRPRASVVML